MDYQANIDRMLRELKSRGIRDQRVIQAFKTVPRHRFVEPALAHRAYGDTPLPIGSDQTISHPYVVAYMTQLLAVKDSDRVLEVGTGSGYQTAILSELALKVYSIERHRDLSRAARTILDQLGYHTTNLMVGDGTAGWPDKSPFDAILVTASYDNIPKALLEQLAVGGRLVMPVGRDVQHIKLAVRHQDAIYYERKSACRFVPLVGRHGHREEA